MSGFGHPSAAEKPLGFEARIAHEICSTTGKMDSASRLATPRELHERARFEALRRRIFDDLGHAAARWRLTWILPFTVLVVVLLAVRGESGPRVVIQSAAVAVLGALFITRVFSNHVALKVASFLLGIATYFALVATTGGLASPLVVLGALMIAAAAITLREPGWLRSAVFIVFLAGFVALAALSSTAVGQLVGPLAPTASGSSAEYVILALFAAIFATVGVNRIGCTMTIGYERAALELAERREELCSENEDRTRALEGMAARLAHEVKNPLAAIKGLSTHMARNATDPKTAERLAIVAAEAGRLQSIVDGFLSFSRGLDDLKLAPTKPHEVARELAVLLETRAEEAGVTIELTGDEGLELDADARKLRQALLNIVLNAIQASPRGAGVHISVARECFEGARITVRDDGLGMTPEVLERIRKPYFTTKEGGTGLGVAVARGLIEQHGGRVEFKSVAGRGTTVSLVLPMKPTPCTRLPNPLRSIQPEVQETDKPEPASAGAR
jgi:signal transduction histidine kinase